MFAAACGSSSSSSPAGASSPSSGSAVASNASSTSSASNSPYPSGGATSSAGAPTTAATDVTTKHSKFGTILAAGPKQLTVYAFDADKGPTSHCSGACAVAWPPVIARSDAMASGSAKSSDLGTTMRSGGVKQVTYKGQPLYYFIKDKDDGDAYGQGSHAFGADWYVVAPSGDKVDNS
jgi:predicted lipoprotein with Yx(FWY)xxD motif